VSSSNEQVAKSDGGLSLQGIEGPVGPSTCGFRGSSVYSGSITTDVPWIGETAHFFDENGSLVTTWDEHLPLAPNIRFGGFYPARYGPPIVEGMIHAHAVPEASTAVSLGCGLAGLVVVMRRRRQASRSTRSQ
jgi:hypothetical protein